MLWLWHSQTVSLCQVFRTSAYLSSLLPSHCQHHQALPSHLIPTHLQLSNHQFTPTRIKHSRPILNHLKTMAEQFLTQLLGTQNQVSSDEKRSQRSICLERCGDMIPETGLIERAVRLPCQHIVGSGCISQWLQTNNTCPICRQVFFPVESGPDTAEPHFIESPSVSPPPAQDLTPRGLILSGPIDICLSYLREIRRLCDDYCTRLHLQPQITQIVVALFSNLLAPGPSNVILQDCSDDLVVALSIYIASGLACQPRSPEEIAAAITSVDYSQVLIYYGHLNILADREAMIDEGTRSDLRDDFNVETLCWPEDWNERR